MSEQRHYLEQYDNGDPGLFVSSEIREEQLSELAPLVGETVFLFNSLESDLDRMIANMINERSHQPGYTVVSELSPVFTKKILVLKGLYGPSIQFFDDKELINMFDSLCKRLFKIKDARNEVSHANWLGATDDYEVRLRISTDEGGPYALRKKMDPDYIRRQISELQEIIKSLETFDAKMEEAIMGHS